jgi:hypothetical protein
VAAALTCGALGLTGCAATASSAATTPSPSASSAHGFPAGGAGGAGGGSNARSGPAEGGSSGTITSVSGSSFTLTTAAGQKVTVKESSTTAYTKGTSASSASALAKGESVLVLGMTDSTTITASQVTMQPAATSGSADYTPSSVASFTRGTPSTSKSDGQIPTDYTEGSGTIVSGSTANQAAEAALATYPGGVVDRVVQLGDGEYEVHYIGVNWPHHIFVNSSFTVVGAD